MPPQEILNGAIFIHPQILSLNGVVVGLESDRGDML